jgi:hypothetical protein
MISISGAMVWKIKSKDLVIPAPVLPWAMADAPTDLAYFIASIAWNTRSALTKRVRIILNYITIKLNA